MYASEISVLFAAGEFCLDRPSVRFYVLSVLATVFYWAFAFIIQNSFLFKEMWNISSFFSQQRPQPVLICQRVCVFYPVSVSGANHLLWPNALFDFNEILGRIKSKRVIEGIDRKKLSSRTKKKIEKTITIAKVYLFFRIFFSLPLFIVVNSVIWSFMWKHIHSQWVDRVRQVRTPTGS